MEMETENEPIDIDLAEAEEIEAKFNLLKEIIPDADHLYLHDMSVEYVWQKVAFEQFVHSLIEKNDYPRKLDPVKVEEDPPTAPQEPFQLEQFLQQFPQPLKYFTESQRGTTFKKHTLYYLKKRFRSTSVKDIMKELRKSKYSLTLAYKKIEALKPSRVTKRSNVELFRLMSPTDINIDFLNEVAFIEHEQEISDFLRAKELGRKEALDKARASGELVECGCCCNDELLIEDMVNCDEGHFFCKDCGRRSSEILLGDGKINFPCLSSCGSEFSDATLKELLPDAAFEKLIRRRQEVEVQAAGISGLESCPFCEYAEIPPEGDRIFECKSCMIKSCRLCKALSHIPFRCDEAVENEKQNTRTFIEDKMTQALLRTCYQCKRKFIKEDGCNKMTCTCGAKMCYLCQKPVENYNHFVDKKNVEDSNKCPLYSNNQDLHIVAVRKAGEEAKVQVLKNHRPVDTEYDPFKGLEPSPKPKPKPKPVLNRIRARNNVLPFRARNLAQEELLRLLPGNMNVNVRNMAAPRDVTSINFLSALESCPRSGREPQPRIQRNIPTCSKVLVYC